MRVAVSPPARLNKEFYVPKIQPQLMTVKVREVAQAKRLRLRLWLLCRPLGEPVRAPLFHVPALSQ